MQASIEPRAPNSEIQIPFGRGMFGEALPENVAGGAEAEEVVLPDAALTARPEPYVIVVGPSMVIVDVRVLVL